MGVCQSAESVDKKSPITPQTLPISLLHRLRLRISQASLKADSDSTSGFVLRDETCETRDSYARCQHYRLDFSIDRSSKHLQFDPQRQYLARLKKDVIIRGRRLSKDCQFIVDENSYRIQVLDGSSEIYSLANFRQICIEAKTFSRVNTEYTNSAAWFAISREEAERMLIIPGNVSGTYLLRPSKRTNQIALSMRVEREPLKWTVKHYRIDLLPNSQYRIFADRIFSNIMDLCQFCFHHAHKNFQISSQALLRSYPSWCTKPPLEALVIDATCLKFSTRIGKGSFGEVWQGILNDKLQVAIKKLLPSSSMQPARFLQEAKIMHFFDHPRIVKLLGICNDRGELSIITEFFELGSLYDVMRRSAHLDNCFQLETLQSFMLDIADGMTFLEEHNFIHRDLRSANILVENQMRLKVSDFGLSHLLSQPDSEYFGTSHTPFPVRFTAPEGMLENKYSVKSDVWSFGVLCYEILTCCAQPYEGMKYAEIKQFVCVERRTLEIPLVHLGGTAFCDCPEEIYKLIDSCWEFNPHMRPTFRALKNCLSF
ncbi:hypothetical protein Ciccas_009013 [Cichlidogyrus casuarinus]|uniref:Tyrosine-protein kinase n=1 Tax=Cichlidogyrus casuarinus TaxID=1844966 RepID=A0ABD2PY98_9PLAT